jgi:hypothetical protein
MAVLVLGMHRSGTSAAAGTLVRLGLTPPRTMFPASADNPGGFYESVAVSGLNDLLLHAAGCTWSDCLAFDAARFDDRARSQASEIVTAALREEFANAPAFLVKDPRLSLTLPLWLPALDALSTTCAALLVVRHPMEVVRSLRLRDRLPEEAMAAVWLHHILEAEHTTRSLPRAIVFYDDLMADWRACLTRASRFAGAIWPGDLVRCQPGIDAFLNRSFRHHHVAPEGSPLIGPPLVRELIGAAWPCFQMLRDGPASSAVLANLDRIRSAFTGWRSGGTGPARTGPVGWLG